MDYQYSSKLIFEPSSKSLPEASTPSPESKLLRAAKEGNLEVGHGACHAGSMRHFGYIGSIRYSRVLRVYGFIGF